MTSQTSALAVDIASDKKMTNQFAAAGPPVPRSEVVRDADAAVASARASGTRSSRSPSTATTGAAWV